MNVMTMFFRYQSDLKKIEQQLMHVFDNEPGTIKDASTHLLKAGGKRLRPLLVILTSRFGLSNQSDPQTIAVALELIHMATLVHDDVIDLAPMRRGNQTVMAKWDARIAMYIGDFVFAKALEIISQTSSKEVHLILSDAIVKMCQGEFDQMKLFFNLDQKMTDYWRRIKRKTALLIAVSCQLGAIGGGVSDSLSKTLHQIGYLIGMAFQIIDDILDLSGTEAEIGKPPGNDIKQGNITLPVLLALRDSSIAPFLRSSIQTISQGEHPEILQEVLTCIRRSGTIDTSRKIAEKLIDRALILITKLPQQREKEELIELANFVIKRKN